MEVFTGDRTIRNPNDVVLFPDNLTPFPETGYILSDDQAAEIRPPAIDHRLQPPPQKLRPIRCNGRTLPEYSDHTVPENEYLEETLLSCYGGASPELGFLTQKIGAVAEECSGSQAYFGSGGCAENGGGGGGVAGKSCSLVDNTAVQQIKSEMNAEFMNLISEGSLLDADLSSSSNDGNESSEAIKEPLNRKRKRKTRKMLKLFLESMMKKVMQKQEQMHKQLIEMLEEKEKERILREEAWKQQVIERAKRDEEARAHEISRSLALISFIQNLLGREIQIPETSEILCLEKDLGEINNQDYLKCEPSKRKWPNSEIQALITVRTALDHKFLKVPKGAVWEEVAVGLSNMGYSRTAKKCKEKWENINKYYRKTMESGKKRPDNSKSCPYFHELDILYKSGLISSGNTFICMKNEIEEKSVND